MSSGVPVFLFRLQTLDQLTGRLSCEVCELRGYETEAFVVRLSWFGNQSAQPPARNKGDSGNLDSVVRVLSFSRVSPTILLVEGIEGKFFWFLSTKRRISSGSSFKQDG